MQDFLAITKALSDATRVRALLSLRGGELCLCQIIALLELSPSTVSKHMDVLYQARLIERRKEGRWQFFRLAERNGTPVVRQALSWAQKSLADEPILAADVKKLRTLRKRNLDEVSACYRGN